MSRYVVLRQTRQGNAEGAETWERHDEAEAASAAAAIRVTADSATGFYVALPARSFKPVNVTVETQKVVKLS